MLEKEGMKNTIFLDAFTPAPPDRRLGEPSERQPRRSNLRHFTCLIWLFPNLA